MTLEIFQQLGVALALSSLIGLEREQKFQKYGDDSFGGVRTFALIGLMGALAYILGQYSIVYFGVLTGGFFMMLVAFYWATVKKYGAVGGTSDIAAVIVYIVGILSAMGQFLLATVVALVTLTILHFKGRLHKWAKHLKNKEIVSTIQFIIIAFVILPLLPNLEMGPFGFFNPYIVWLMVVFISGISFLSYIAIKFFGTKKGIGITGFLAGFISSTALVLSFSGDSKKNKGIVNPYVLAVVVASSAMFFRILLEVGVLSPELLNKLWLPIGLMGFVGILSVMFLWGKKDKSESKIEKEMSKVCSPFSLKPALKFGVFFALISLFTKVGFEHFGEKGLYLTSLISGIMDVDAITVSMAGDFSTGKVSEMSAVIAITIAAMTNTVVKGGIFMLFGSRKTALKIVSVFGLMLIVGVISLFFVF